MSCKRQLSVAAIAMFAVVAGGSPAWAVATFPGAGTDTTTSLGTFTINLNPAVQALFGGATAVTSPLLSDPSTSINRSAPIVGGQGAVLTTGVTVGSTTSAYSNLAQVPGGFTNSACSGNCPDQVMTMIASFNLTGGGYTVAAGTAGKTLLATTSAPALPSSFGIVQSNTGVNGTGPNDFPAKSFFDVFVTVEIPAPGGGDLILSNQPTTGTGTPLVVQSTDLMAFPPTVVYVHTGSTNPTIYLDGETGTSAFSSDIGASIGTISLAGHGIGYNTTPGSEAAFYSAFAAEESLFVPEPASALLLAAGLGPLALLRRRRKNDSAG